jgi:hypothetical protein
MKELLESLDISEDTKTKLIESFETAVSKKASDLVEAKESEYEEYMFAQLTEAKESLENKLDNYLDKVVEQFVEENTISIDKSIDIAKHDAVLEGFNSLLVASGVQIKDIVEAKEVKDVKVDESSQAIADRLMIENTQLQERNAELLKTGLIKETSENMTTLQKDKFYRLADLIEFSHNEPTKFVNKLDTLAESIKEVKVEPSKVPNKPNLKDMNEKVEDSNVYQSKAKHLF